MGVLLAPKHDLLTLKEVAGILRISRTAMYDLTRKSNKKKPFPIVRINNRIRIPRAQFMAWAGLAEDNT